MLCSVVSITPMSRRATTRVGQVGNRARTALWFLIILGSMVPGGTEGRGFRHPDRRATRVAYDLPRDQAHREIYDTMRQRRVLERVAAAFDLFKLPRRMTYRLTACSGEPNAWYDRAPARLRHAMS